ncbi:MAG: hypothetical protein IJ571_08100 [Ruminococcus sp.]|nr:hypothetical protein [Ruminococcus sp.]
MDNKKFRNGMLFGIIGAILTLLGDLLIGANPASDITTGSQMVDMFIDAAGNSELRMVFGGMLGAVGIPITALGYYQLYERLFKPLCGIMPTAYKLGVFATAVLGGAGVHLPCAVIPMLYKWIAPTDPALAASVAERYSNWFMMPSMVIFGVLLFAALIYQTIVIFKGKTAYKRRAALYNMAIGVAVSYVLAWAIGKNAVGNGIGTGAISIGHLYMFTMFYADMPKEYIKEET